MTTTITNTTPMKKITEDPRMRPFLSSLFDSQTYIRTVIKEERSEECFQNIVNCIDEVNLEIKSYISQHKDDLMFGMQDVATLADRYANLAQASQKLKKNISRLKKETIESHQLVSLKTTELERIHETTALLHQLKQFVHAKSQLDHYLNNSEEKDIRNLSSVAKMLSELEKLLTIPKLTKINIVSDSIGSIKLFGENIRKLSQERLITSILEKNQASIASCLQVFYNLESLPEVILLVIDTIVRQTVELSSNLLDFEVLNSYQSELFMSPLATNTTTMNTSTNTTISNNLSNTNTPMKSTNTLLSKHNSNKAPLTLVQLRILIREIAHNWSTILSEKAIQIHVFQRILSKKEDPTTHEKFLDVLYKRGNEKNHQTISSTNSISTTKLSNLPRELINGRLLELFWYRLGVALVDISIDKMKLYPYAASRAYPYLRKATVEVVDNLLSITRTEYGSNGKNDRLIAMLSSNNFHIDEEKYYENSNNNLDYDTHENQQSSMFGSLEWTQLELIQSSLPYNNRTNKSYNNHNYNHNLNNNKIIDVSNGSDTNNIDNNEEIPLLLGLKPMRDTYLINVLGRMTGPVMQMFPEIEGYTAAVPSKRDLQALTRAIQSEFIIAVTESEAGLVLIICKEFLKIVRLMLTKIEGMVINSPETRKISVTNNFLRTQQQEHNGQLVALLIQFRDALERIPSQVMKYAIDNGSINYETTLRNGHNKSGITNNNYNNCHSNYSDKTATSFATITKAMNESVLVAINEIEELCQKQVLSGIIDVLANYITSQLLSIHKEGVVTVLAPKNISTGSTDMEESSIECSTALQSVTKQLPTIIRVHLQSLPKCELVEKAIEEICLRTINSYVSISALLRPVNEQTRLRTAKDLSALEMLLSGISTRLFSVSDCPIVQEFRSYRRLLFYEETDGTNKPVGITPQHPPNRKTFVQLPYLFLLRPSTLLGYLISCGPPQLPSPYTITQSSSLQSYIEVLLDVQRELLSKQYINDYNNDYQSVNSVGNSLSTTGFAKYGVRTLYNPMSWKSVDNENKCWEIIQKCLDTLFQRVAVTQSQQKQLLRDWYEALLDIGTYLFGGNLTK